MNALRQSTRLLRHRSFQQIRAAHQDTTAPAQQRKVDGEIGIASGAPENIYKRQVIIYAPARTAGQQGKAQTVTNAGNGPAWKLIFDTQQKWENPLIGWTSTADPLDNVGRATLNFHTQEDAESFCRKHGWQYEVSPPKEQTETRPRRYIGYGDNFSVKRHGYPEGGLRSEGGAAKDKK
ncbi:g13172 [Coccomyxa viridis]|uniref:NADH dehydrogenase [ubiquinone] iron-sulfur protein 4, mitochondrial n=1 Tax=Coccomyxa viridis TaxID=1274662 RepID=A0ABP1GJA0_9CHLO